MPPKTKFNQEVVLEAAYQLAREEGFTALSARSVADRLGSSTAPIYSSFPSMEELVHAVFLRAKGRLHAYMDHGWTSAPFLNMGIGIVMFARDESVLFRTLLFDAPTLSIADESESAKSIEMMSVDPMFETLPREVMGKILEQMSVVTYGLATIVTSGSLPQVDTRWIADWLNEIGGIVIAEHFRRAGVVPPPEHVGVQPQLLQHEPPPPGETQD